MVGCTTTHGRFDHRAKAQRVDRQHHRSGDDLGKQVNSRDKYMQAARRIRVAIEEGKMTPEEGREMMEALRKRVKGRGKSMDRR